MRWRSIVLQLIKAVLWRLMRRRAFFKWTRLISEEHQGFVAAQVARQYGPAIARGVGFQVVRGPFQGLRYPPELDPASLVTKLLGAYEEELHPIVEAACRRSYRTIVNVGAAEGYYAVGLAMRTRATTVYAFEAEPSSAAALGTLARANGVAERIVIGGVCTREELSRCPLGPETFVLMDCEGCEWTVLDPALVPELASCDLLVELHRLRDNQPRTLIQNAFGGSHAIAFVDARQRDSTRYPELRDLRDFERTALLFERTPHHEGWAHLRARALP